MLYLIQPLLGFALSFIGSMPLGMINVTVADTAMRKGYVAALWVALGAALIELVQAFVAIKLAAVLTGNSTVGFWFNAVATAIFLLLTCYYFFIAKPLNPQINRMEQGSNLAGFSRGLFVSSLNVMVFPYWIIYGTYLKANGWLLTDTFNLFLFCLGVMGGTFILLLLYARLGAQVLKRSLYFAKRANAVLGGIFLLLTIYQGGKWIGVF